MEKEYKCRKCGQLKDIKLSFHKDRKGKGGHTTYCKDCASAIYKEWYRNKKSRRIDISKDYYRNNREQVLKKKLAYSKTAKGREISKTVAKRQTLKKPERRKVYGIVGYAVKMGTLTKKPCRDCGESRVEGHHPDYTKPLEVVWLCKKHHMIEEGKWVGEL